MHRLFAYHFKPLVVGFLLFTSLASLRAQPVLTLEEAIQEALQNNKALQQARNSRKIDAYNHHISKTDFFPTLTLPSIGATWPESNTHHRRTTHSLSAHTWYSNEIGLGWKLKPSSLFSYQTLRTQDQISELKWQQNVATQIAETIKAYYSLVLARKKQKVGMERLVVAKETLQLAKAKHEVGQETALDYLDAQVTYEQAQAAFRKQEEYIANQKRELGRRLGRNEWSVFDVVEEIPLPELLAWETLLATYKTASPALLLAQKQHKSSTNTLKLKQADRLFPSLGLDFTYACWEEKPRYGIKLTLDFTDIFHYAINVRKERLEEENYRLTLASTRVDEKEKLRNDFLVYARQLQSFQIKQRSVQVSRGRAAEALEHYRLGRKTLLALKKQQQETQEAILSCLEMHFELKNKEIALRNQAGMLPGNYGL